MSKGATLLPQIGPILSSRDFENFRKLAYDKFGLNLTDSKHELVAARLSKKLREMKIPTYSAYYEHVMADRTGESLIALIDALSTNHTFFLREAAHFDFLRSVVLPKLRDRPRVNVWSAPCSTGEEPFSIAITLLEAFGMPPRPDVQILATDISTRALATAQRGIYSRERVRSMPPAMIKKYFVEAGPAAVQVRPEMRRLMEFARVNLVEPLTEKRTFPIIFCRNLMIYFDKATQERLVTQLTERLEPGGYLLIGHSESLMGASHALEYIQPAVYRRSDGLKSAGARK